MNNLEIISLVVTIVCLVSFSAVFTVLFRHYYNSNIESINKGNDDLDLLNNALEIEKAKTDKKKKALKIVSKSVSYLIFAIILVFFGFSLYSRFSGNTMPFGNTSLVVIASGSMSEKNEDNTYLANLNNQFNTYDIIGISKYDNQSDVNLYDVVAFKNEDGTTIVHRIIEVEEVNGETVYITRGDSNNVSDNGSQYEDYLHYENIIGYYNGTRIQTLGIFVIFLQSNAGIITIIAIGYCLFMFDYYNNKFENAVNDRTSKIIEALEFSLSDDPKKVKLLNTETLIYNDKKVNFLNGEYLYEVSPLTEEDKIEFEKCENFINSQKIVENCKDLDKKENYFQKTFSKFKKKFFENNKEK